MQTKMVPTSRVSHDRDVKPLSTLSQDAVKTIEHWPAILVLVIRLAALIFKEDLTMKTGRFLIPLLLLAILLAACSPAAAPTQVERQDFEGGKTAGEPPIVVEPLRPAPTAIPEIEAGESGPVYHPPEPTQAPLWSAPGAIPTPADNYFRDYGVNPFVDSYEDHLSTFALDVDTASYSVARRYIMDGNLPPAEAVRVEEFVNSFDLGYPTPEEVAFGIYADGAPSPFHDDGSFILRIGIQGYQVPEWQRKPAALTFVIDVSGSMDRENRLELVKRSLQLLVDRLRPEDTVAIVAYGTQAYIVLEPTPGDDRETILQAIYTLRPEGSTNAEAGLHLGYQLAMQAYLPGGTNRVILCSDGVANVGETGPDEILRTIRSYVEEGVMLTTVGFGMGNFNDVLLEQLANDGNGFYAYVDGLDEARKLFLEDLTSTLQVIALDAKVQVDFNPEVASYYRLIGYENRDVADRDFRNDSVDAGELGAGHSATALYAIHFEPGAEGRLATVQLRWQDPDNHKVHEINGNINTWDLSRHFEDAAPHYRLAVVAAFAAEVLRSSPWAGDVSLGQLYRLAAPLVNEIPWDPDVAEFVDLLGRASQIRY
jgi:Ca-activated chloride channel family protein